MNTKIKIPEWYYKIIGSNIMRHESFVGQGQSGNSGNYMVIDVEVIPEQFDDKEIIEYLMDKNFPWKIHPLFSRILVIGCKLPGRETELLYYNDEAELLLKFWGKLQEIKPNLIVTFNGYNFDIPFIQIRSQFRCIKPTLNINMNKWKMENSNHLDCMQILSASQAFLNVALDISCKVFKIPVPKPRYYGDDIYKLYEDGDMEAIKEHCRQDVELTEQLYLKLRK